MFYTLKLCSNFYALTKYLVFNWAWDWWTAQHAKKAIKLSMTFQKTIQTDHDTKSLAAWDAKSWVWNTKRKHELNKISPLHTEINKVSYKIVCMIDNHRVSNKFDTIRLTEAQRTDGGQYVCEARDGSRLLSRSLPVDLVFCSKC